MNNVMTIIKKELSRFFGDRRLVFTTVIMPGLMIYLMYSLMGKMMVKEFSTSKDYVAKAYAVNMPKELEQLFLTGNGEQMVIWEAWDGNPADQERILKEIANGEKDLLIYFPEHFLEDVNDYQVVDPNNAPGSAPGIEIYYSSEKTNSSTTYNMVLNRLDAWEETMANKFDVNAAKLEGRFGAFDQASENGIVGKMLAGLLPMLIMTFIFSGCQGVAPESIAGEKERGTVATLLVTPVKRGAQAIGKVVSLSIVAMLSGISSFLGTILSMPKMMGDQVDFDAGAYATSDYLMLFFVIVSTVLVLVSIISIISASANSVKEATTMMAPFMIAIMLISLLPMLGMEFGGKIAFLIPLFNSVKSMSGIFGFKADLPMVIVTICVNLVAAGALVMVLTKMFSSEKVMFSK